MSLAAAIERAEVKGHDGNPDGEAFPSEAAFFIDFASLHQKDAHGERTPAEAAAFGEALSGMQVWYAHPLATAFLTRSLPAGYESVPGYAERGWPTCESSWAALAKASRLVSWAPIFDVVASKPYARPPPMAPAAMARLVASKRFTSKKGDLPMVIELNTRTILSLFGSVTELSYGNLGWGDAEVAQLCKVLASGSLEKVFRLYLGSNNFGDVGVSALADAMGKGSMASVTVRKTQEGGAGTGGCLLLGVA